LRGVDSVDPIHALISFVPRTDPPTAVAPT